jgi:glutamate racemase
VIRPTVEVAGDISKSHHIGIMATPGTVRSKTYELEMAKLFPNFQVTSEACPMWVPLVENEEYNTPGADYFVRKHIDNLLQQDPQIDSVILGCTHYPLLRDKIRQWMPDNIHIIEQGNYVAQSLKDYLSRHQNMSEHITTDGTIRYLTTEQADVFQAKATIFMDTTVEAERVFLE